MTTTFGIRTSQVGRYVAVLFGAVGGCAAPHPTETDPDSGVVDSALLDLGDDGGGFMDMPPMPDATVDAEIIRDAGMLVDLGTPETPLAIDDLIYAMSIKYCREILTCPTTFDSDTERFIKLYESDEAACVTGYARLLASYSRLQENVDRVRAGTLTFDGIAAHACLDEMTCERFDLDGIGSYGPCDTMFDGNVAIDGACQSSDDCAGIDTFCEFDSDPCTGTCKPTLPRGSECRAGRDCATAGATELVVCDTSGETSACRDFDYTTAEATVGAPCGFLSSDTTVTHANCAPGFYCSAPSWTGVGTCQMQLAEGFPCTSPSVCQASYVCSRDEVPVCAAPPAMSQFIGEGCSSDFGPVCDGWRNLGCIDGTCAALGDGTLGSACDDHTFCNSGLFCDDSWHCAAQLADGTTCHSHNQCASGRCSDATFTCDPTPSC